MYSKSNVENVIVNVRNVTQQTDGYSCGFLALAYAQAIAGNKRPEELNFETNGCMLRKNVVDWVKTNKVTQFISTTCERRKDLRSFEIEIKNN